MQSSSSPGGSTLVAGRPSCMKWKSSLQARLHWREGGSQGDRQAQAGPGHQDADAAGGRSAQDVYINGKHRKTSKIVTLVMFQTKVVCHTVVCLLFSS